MALSSTLVWEVRTSGSDNNGGGFKAGASGTDYSQQASAQKSNTDLAIHASDNTKVQPVAAGVAAADIGNIVQITAGSGFTTGFYEIVSQDGTYWTLDRAAGTVGSTGGTYAMGGALASPGKLGSAMVAGNDAYIKSGTYTVTSASSNVANGCLTLPAAASATNIVRLIGYNSTRGDDGTKPVIAADGVITSTNLISAGSGSRIENIECDCNNRSNVRGFSGASGAMLMRCRVRNASYRGIEWTTSVIMFCEAINCSGLGFLTLQTYYCTAQGCATGFNMSQSYGLCVGCAAISCTARGFDWSSGNPTMMINCLAYNCTSDGFRPIPATGLITFINCLAVNNGAYGFTASSSGDHIFLYNCAGYNNTSGNVNSTNIPSAQQIGFVALSGDPFTNAAGLDFSLDNTTAEGAALRGTGLPGLASGLYGLPGLSTNAYPDIGAAQHQDSGGGGRGGLIF